MVISGAMEKPLSEYSGFMPEPKPKTAMHIKKIKLKI